MLDIKFVRENPDAVKENIKKKFQDAKLPLVDEVIEKDAKYRECLKEVESLKAARNKLSKANGPLFGQLKKCDDEAKKAELQAQIDANNAAVKADAALAREKGRYALFEGSDWQTGAYFEKRGYTSEKWQALAETVAVQGMRNAYLLAVAPTSSTSILSGTSAGIDPIMKKFFLEEKKGSMLPRVAPELSMDTWWYYKAAHLIDQSWSVRAAGLRQRHIDQAQSMNLYITNDYSMRQVLRLYLEAWRVGVKTIYYVRSKALEVEDCESCSS